MIRINKKAMTKKLFVEIIIGLILLVAVVLLFFLPLPVYVDPVPRSHLWKGTFILPDKVWSGLLLLRMI